MLRTNTTTLEQNIKNGEYFLFPEFEIENNIFWVFLMNLENCVTMVVIYKVYFFFNITVLSCT